MWAREDTSRRADVVATFENQDDADGAVLQLRLAGFRDRQIGYVGRLPNGRLLDLLERDHWIAGVVLGGIVGAALGIVLAPALAWLMAPPSGVHDLFGLAMTCGVCGLLFGNFVGGWIGMSMTRRGVAPPPTGPADGPFVLAVSAGDASTRAAEIMHHYHGHDLHMEAAT